MSKPVIKSGRFEAGAFFECGENVVVEVAESVTVGDRCRLADNTYLGGRRITIGSDFYGYAAMDVGRGRRDDQDAILTVGKRNTWHNNRIDLARHVTIGDDVGLSPDVVAYSHSYWQSFLEGYPWAFEPVVVESGVIVGFRSVLLPGAHVGRNAVIGAQSVVSGRLEPDAVYGGNPARLLRTITPYPENHQRIMLDTVLRDYAEACGYRNWTAVAKVDFPKVWYRGCVFDVAKKTVEGDEDEYTDDFRDFLFRRGIRFYSARPFRKLGIRQGGE